jgi:uncharacterized protein (DUF697 family)
MPKNTEPVLLTVLIPIIVWLGARYGFDVSEGTASAIAGGLLVVLGGFTHRSVTPLADPQDNEGRKLKPERSN